MATVNDSSNCDPDDDDIHSRIISRAKTGSCTGVFYGSFADAMKISAEKLAKLDQSNPPGNLGSDSK